jgi:primosomal protein N' (replication factor Y) (superfamily II helicase)
VGGHEPGRRPAFGARPLIVRVLPDLPAVNKTFDYLVDAAVPVGTIVRVDLQGRRVRGWVVDLPSAPVAGVVPRPVSRVSSAGPPPEVVSLARWAAWRWAGRWVHLLRTASPPASVPLSRIGGSYAPISTAATPSCVVRRVPPAADRLPIVRSVVAEGPAIVVVPAIDAAERLAARLRRDGRAVAVLAGDVRVGEWERAASGEAVVVGTRVAVWAPIPDAALTGVLVLDEHDEALQAEQAPTWHARDVAIERARQAGVPCTLVSPVPTLHALASGDVVEETGRWPLVEVVDRRSEDPAKAGLFSPALVRALRGGERVVCVLNRLGRSRLLACVACGETATCERCGGAVSQPSSGGVLTCSSCQTERPVVCSACGGARFKNLRMGVTRAQEELAVLVGEAVAEVTAESELGNERVAVGTEAVLHRLRARSVDVVAFLDLDQELLAPRYRAGEQALSLLARAARAVRGRLLVQTRLPDHPVVRAAVRGEPSLFTALEAERRRGLLYPPFAALAVVSGQGAPAWGEAALAAATLDVEVLGPYDGRWLVRAPDPSVLADWLGTIERPPGRLRIEVDPTRSV